jgi:hypothetical protein
MLTLELGQRMPRALGIGAEIVALHAWKYTVGSPVDGATRAAAA